MPRPSHDRPLVGYLPSPSEVYGKVAEQLELETLEHLATYLSLFTRNLDRGRLDLAKAGLTELCDELRKKRLDHLETEGT
jgi:hypothetical protein